MTNETENSKPERSLTANAGVFLATCVALAAPILCYSGAISVPEMVSAWLACGALAYANLSANAALDATWKANTANALATEANRISVQANALATTSNTHADDANTIAREANEIARSARDAANRELVLEAAIRTYELLRDAFRKIDLEQFKEAHDALMGNERDFFLLPAHLRDVHRRVMDLASSMHRQEQLQTRFEKSGDRKRETEAHEKLNGMHDTKNQLREEMTVWFDGFIQPSG